MKVIDLIRDKEACESYIRQQYAELYNKINTLDVCSTVNIVKIVLRYRDKMYARYNKFRAKYEWCAESYSYQVEDILNDVDDLYIEYLAE